MCFFFPVTFPLISPLLNRHLLLLSYPQPLIGFQACLTAADHLFVKAIQTDAPSLSISVSSFVPQELIPLILCTACLHPEPKERDQLLHILFNLIKRPDDEQRCVCLQTEQYAYSFWSTLKQDANRIGRQTISLSSSVFSYVSFCVSKDK